MEATMARTENRLVPVTLGRLKESGIYSDGKGLYFRIGPTGAKSWIFRFDLNKKRHEMGLGSFSDVTLAEAREKAKECRKLQKARINPIEARRLEIEAEQAKRVAAVKKITFKECALACIAAHEKSWKSPKHIYQWPATLESYVYPVFGDLPVDAIDTPLVESALRPIWTDKPETATRVRGRIEHVLNWAKVKKLRSGPNPALWRGHLDQLFPRRSKVAKVVNFPALRYSEISEFMEGLRDEEGYSARALEFLILTAARTGEVTGARWREINFEAEVWTVPADRMKMKREHRVPLTPAAMAILKAMKAVTESDYIFPGSRAQKPLPHTAMLRVLSRMGRDDITVHGFRSTFKDWASEETHFPNELSEMALAHAIKNKVEESYRRGELLAKRRKLMEAWADYCGRINSAEIAKSA
jgi:integrase